MPWYKDPTRYLFFTGKGGVGKTSIACATAVKLADAGKRVLLVSTDPASNLGQVFGVEVGKHEPMALDTVPNLAVLNIDPEAAARAYRERTVGPVRNLLPARTICDMEEQLSGACTTEIAAFDEFTALLTDGARTAEFAHLILDTAPTGHTLRLLKLPAARTSFLESNQSGATCLGPLAGLDKQRQQYAAAVGALATRESTTVILVSRPQRTSLEEAARTSDELRALGVTEQRLVLNGLMPEGVSTDPVAQALLQRDRDALAQAPQSLTTLPTDRVLLQPHNLVGVAALRSLLDASSVAAATDTNEITSRPSDVPSLAELVDRIAADGHGLVMVMGKGGVGKTTIAAAVAVELAGRGFDVHLTTTDPASHVAATIGSELDRLQVSRIDPQVETDRYRQHVLETKGQGLDERGRALLEEDLRSPCTEEVAVFEAFSQVIGESEGRFVVIDTAPTGHTLLLLDATGGYHREVVRHTRDSAPVVTPLMQLQDPERTKLLIVTAAETTPVLEAAALQADLGRAGITPWAWVINASLAATRSRDPLLAARARSEQAHIDKVTQQLAKRTALVPWLVEEPVGPTRLRQLTRGDTKVAVTWGAGVD